MSRVESSPSSAPIAVRTSRRNSNISRNIQLKLTVPPSSEVSSESLVLVGTTTNRVPRPFMIKSQNTAVRRQRPILSLPVLQARAIQKSKADSLSAVDSKGEAPKPESVVENNSYENTPQLVLPESLSVTPLEKDDFNSHTPFRHAEEGWQTLDRNVDVIELDDDGWLAASESKRIIPLKSLGEGAGGSVTQCVLDGSSTVFAVKTIPAVSTPHMSNQISRELKFGKLCKSDYICSYYGVFSNKKSATINIAMEYCDGGSLEAIYKKVQQLGGRIGEKPLVRIAEHILTGLEYLEQHKIIHRDIKPSNILFSRSGNVKLCDFGVSGDVGPEGEAYTCIGTSYYMAPERMRGEKYTVTSDVWSLGITLLEIAYNRFPFPDGEKLAFFDFLAFIASEAIELKDEPENRISWSPHMKSFIDHCLQKHQSRRLTPGQLLELPWIMEGKQREINMESFMRAVQQS